MDLRLTDEQQMVRSMPALSWRNYVALGLQGPERVVRRDRGIGHGWGPEFARPDRRPDRVGPTEADAEVLRRRLAGGPADSVDLVEEGVFAAQGYFLARPGAEAPEATEEFRAWLGARRRAAEPEPLPPRPAKGARPAPAEPVDDL